AAAPSDSAGPLVLVPRALVQGELRVGLALRDRAGELLSTVLRAGQLAPAAALQVALRLSALCVELHRRGWLLGRAHPEHILLARDAAGSGQAPTGEAGTAVMLSLVDAMPLGSAQSGQLGELSAGELLYATPEQLSGAALSESADLYSIGVLLYQLLAGTPPFVGPDAAAIVHAHLARRPPALAERAPGLPPALLRIVDKLLEKNPGDRYRTAAGLVRDLARVAASLTGAVPADFELGTEDRPSSVALSLPLDARPQEGGALQEAFAAARAGAVQVVLLRGEAGSGKTLIPQRLRGPVRAAQGLFVEVRCEPADGAPNAALAHALRDLTRQLLQEPAQRLATLQRDLAQNLGPGGRALARLTPEIELLLPDLPAAPPLEGGPALNRLRFLLSQFLRTVAQPDRPLVLFFDDGHWLDAGSLRLLVDSLGAAPRLPVLWLLALRRTEGEQTQSLASKLAPLRAAGGVLHERDLLPLSVAELRDLVMRTLGLSESEAAPLSEVLQVKSGGNLLLLSQLLRTLQDDGLLRREAGDGRFTYDLERIVSHGAGAAAQPVLLQRIGRLSEAARHCLSLSACLGPEFPRSALASLSGRELAATTTLLDELEASGLVHRVSAVGSAEGDGEVRYRFLHSSVCQAAEALLSDEERAQTHLRIGQRLLTGEPAALPDSVLMYAVQQLNQGQHQLQDESGRRSLVELNLLSGRRAKAAAGYEAAADFFRAGLSLLPATLQVPAPGETPPPSEAATAEIPPLSPLELQLQRELAESEFLCGRLPAADARAQALLGRLTSPLERAQLLALRARSYLPAARYRDAVTLGLQAFGLLGIEFARDDAELQRWADERLAELGPKLLSLGPEALLSQPLSKDPAHRLRMSLVGLLLPPSFASRPSLFVALVAHALSAVLEHGNTEESCIVFFSYGLLQVTTSDIARGLAFSELAVRLYERLNVHRTAGMALHVHGGHINHWARPLHTSVPILAQSIQVSMAVGDLNHIGNGVFEMVWLLYERGDHLDEVARYAVQALDLAAQIRNEAIRSAVLSCQSFVRCLRAESESGAGDESPPEIFLRETAPSLSRLQQASFGPGIGTYHILHLILRYLFGQPAEAFAAAQAVAPILRQVQSLPIEVAFHLFRGLTVVARIAELGESPELASLLAEDLGKLTRWAAACPENYAPLYALLRAEIARLRNDPLLAEEQYDAAIEGAGRSGFVHYAALANELAARHYLARGRRLVAPTYLRAAYVGYALWGAQSKVRRLAAQHPELSTLASGREARAVAPPLHQALDVAAVVRIGQAISGELQLDQLVEQLLRVALHHAGATRGALLLGTPGTLQLVAHSQQGSDGEVRVQATGGQPLSTTQEVPAELVQAVAGSGSPKVIVDASRDAELGRDPCVLRHQSRSVMVLPLLHRSSVVGVLYLENNLSPDLFHDERTEVLGSLCAQAATAIENAQLYTRLSTASHDLRAANERLEREVVLRTAELQQANQKLAQELAARVENEQARVALQEEVIRMQSLQLAELSTPLVPVAESIMVMPLLGTIDAQRAQDIVEAVLHEAQTSRARVVIIDITGLRRVD
ncbi:MAG TPA: AAA family ATPase, partial [Pseudomonadota bacterium]|nr:AAA family ATPase [Pseudomonadota bacterium]